MVVVENFMSGFAVICDCDGVILQNLAVGEHIGELAEGENFLAMLSEGSQEKWSVLCHDASFGASVVWRRLVGNVRGEEFPCIAASIPSSRILIVGVQGDNAFVALYEEMVCITTHLTNRVRRLHKELAQSEASLLVEMTKVNNDLTNTRRELQKKNLELENANKLLSELAVTDQLTKLYNRRFYATHVTEIIARTRRSNSSLCIAVIDINSFKQVNDTHGHHAGDLLLKRLADCLRSETRQGQDTCYRIGGDEFMITLEGCDEEMGMSILDRIRAKFEEDSLGATLAVGLAAVDIFAAEDEIEYYFKLADQRMYEHKVKQKSGVTS